QVAAHRSGKRVLALLDRRRLESVHLPLLLAGLDILEQRRPLGLRLRLLLRVFGGEEDVVDARALRLDVVVQVRVVEGLQLAVGDVRAAHLLVELLLDQLLDHRPLGRVAHRGRLVEAFALRLLREKLVADERLEELLLAIERAVAGPQGRALLVDAPLELVRGHPLVADVGGGRAGSRTTAGCGGGGAVPGRGAGGCSIAWTSSMPGVRRYRPFPFATSCASLVASSAASGPSCAISRPGPHFRPRIRNARSWLRRSITSTSASTSAGGSPQVSRTSPLTSSRPSSFAADSNRSQ